MKGPTAEPEPGTVCIFVRTHGFVSRSGVKHLWIFPPQLFPHPPRQLHRIADAGDHARAVVPFFFTRQTHGGDQARAKVNDLAGTGIGGWVHAGYCSEQKGK